ncbi:hypothetical protein DL240_18320 [Lujinxingia litoralis]|uniref:Uncharacterized protein n=1 Tax=Lujinxingia litoralis TaxID=2211119 RepID=A0A328C6N7_9DELT|nr:hypothetical protein [Lujinxingia litoralis]RAL20174.1 hypothetical protein DL240_18320 [Lujinxingia litoralis]
MKLRTLAPLQPPPPISGALRSWEHSAPPPALLSWVEGPGAEGIATPWRLGGLCILPPSTLLGLRGFEDAYEDHFTGAAPDGRDVMRVIFDLEKVLRMALYQSVLALELLATSAPLHLEAPLTRPSLLALAEGAITTGVLQVYRGVLPATLDAITAGDRLPALAGLRRLYTASLLHTDAVMSTRLPDLLNHCASTSITPIVEQAADAPLTDAERHALRDELQRLIHTLDTTPSALPERPQNYEFLHHTLVSWRLSLL